MQCFPFNLSLLLSSYFLLWDCFLRKPPEKNSCSPGCVVIVMWPSCECLRDPPSGNYVQRQVERWSRQYRASATHPIPSMDKLMEWLPRQAPSSDKTTVVHGDFRWVLFCCYWLVSSLAILLSWLSMEIGWYWLQPVCEMGICPWIWKYGSTFNLGIG